MTTALKNILTEAGVVNQPPRLIRPSMLAHTTNLFFFYFGCLNFYRRTVRLDCADRTPANPWSWTEGADSPVLGGHSSGLEIQTFHDFGCPNSFFFF